MHEKLMGWLKDHGWRCVRDGDFFADFEKPVKYGAPYYVSVPLNSYASSYEFRLSDAISIVATFEGLSHEKLVKELKRA